MKVVVFVVTVICLAVTPLYADRPHLLLFIQHDQDVDTLHIRSAIEWNRHDLYGNKKERLAKKDVFYGRTEGEKISRQYRVHGENIRVEMVFPQQESGRRLNENTRVELALYQEGRLFFKSQYFGQHSEEYTEIPKSGIKFRPQFLRLSALGGNLYMDIHGVYGKTIYVGNIPAEFAKGFRFESRSIKGFIDDKFMSEAIQIAFALPTNKSNTGTGK